jgi:non-ribosomal peptide synthetase-like protein
MKKYLVEQPVALSTELDRVSEDISVLMGPPPIRMQYYFERQSDASPSSLAVIAGEEVLTYGGLETRANRLANYLGECGVEPGDAVGICLERSANTYVALLAVLKAGAAFVPIDPSYPVDRISFIADDASLRVILSTSGLADATCEAGCPVLDLDTTVDAVAAMPDSRPDVNSEGDARAYIIYTSGTTGRPKGVLVNHSSICAFLQLVSPIYGVTASDRVYQGMTISFDFSIEEIWPTLLAGATLVAGPNDGRRIGSGLAEFLEQNAITVLYCVPTLLATIDRDLPQIHTLMVGGEACPRDLVERWSRPGRRMLNTYGPTETTVTATWCELEPGRPVTIGRPLPGYRTYVLDENLRPVAPGDSGEICIGGIGVAVGYVNRPELTAAKFTSDPFLPGGRLYRSGDWGRFTENGEIEFLGRIDTQVKIRGFRIELGEIESVVLEDPDVVNCLAAPVGSPAQDICAYVTLRDKLGDVSALRDRLGASLRDRVPGYMVPAYVEVLDAIPILPSGKADRKSLPAPVSPRLSVRSCAFTAPESDAEREVLAVWRSVFGRDDIGIDEDFFADLGGHSLFAASAVSRLRKAPGMAGLSVADLYANPTVRSLATLATETGAPKDGRPQPLRHSNARVQRAGVTQFGMLYALLALLFAPVAMLLARLPQHGLHSRPHAWELLVAPSVLLLTCLLPVVLKWTLIGRFKAGRYPLWGGYFCRWWLVRKALEFAPLNYLAGSPLINGYLRLLGARIGKGVHIATSHVHLPDLVEIGDRASIGYDAEIQTFIVEDGWLTIAPVKIGAGAFVGTKAVVLPGAQVEPDARVMEQTLVGRGQTVPAGETWSGSPARRVAGKDRLLDRMSAKPAPGEPVGLLRAAFLVGFVFLELLPVVLALGPLVVIAQAYSVWGTGAAFAASLPAGLVFVLSTMAVVAGSKKLLMPRVGRGVYPVYSWFGFRKWLSDRLMSLSLFATNTLYATLYASPWLRLLGARVGKWSEVSTVSHIDPDLLTLGDGAFVADLATIGAATFHNGYVALDRTEIGNRTFVGNASVVRSRTRMPDNCLIGVASLAPEKEPPAGTSWLGSPAIFLPKRQSVGTFADSVTYKPKAPLVAYRLLVEFFRVVLPASLLFFLGTLVTVAVRQVMPLLTNPAAIVAVMPAIYLACAVVTTLLAVGIKWLTIGKYRPRIEPLWAPFVRHSELATGVYESAAVPSLLALFTGTPLLAPLWRLFGVKIGRRTYIETTFTTEFDLVEVGDDVSVGRAASLQTHLFEDRVMKMSRLHVADGASVGTRAVVLYDSEVGAGASLEALSLNMKGESLPPNTCWSGIPARHAKLG